MRSTRRRAASSGCGGSCCRRASSTTRSPPRKPRDVNFRPRADQTAALDDPAVGNGGQFFTAPAERLPTIARRLGHQRIDVLKIDIEGGEYAVLDDLLRSGPAVRQLLVE